MLRPTEWAVRLVTKRILLICPYTCTWGFRQGCLDLQSSFSSRHSIDVDGVPPQWLLLFIHPTGSALLTQIFSNVFCPFLFSSLVAIMEPENARARKGLGNWHSCYRWETEALRGYMIFLGPAVGCLSPDPDPSILLTTPRSLHWVGTL
jgi:hypothetical protein